MLGAGWAFPESGAGAGAAPPAAIYAAPDVSRLGAAPLNGQAIEGPLYAFVSKSSDPNDVTGIRSVAFSLDGRPVRTEALQPFDLNGDGFLGLAAGYGTTGLRAGRHTVRAKIALASGRTAVVTASFRTASTSATSVRRRFRTSRLAGSRSRTTTTTTAPVTTTTTAAASQSAPSPAPASGTSRLPRFASDSFWYRSIPQDAPLHPASSALVANFDRQWRRYYNNVGINTDRYAPPIFVAGPDTPLRTVRFWDCQNKGWLDPAFAAQMAAVPIPAGTRPSAGTDGELVISQPSTDTVWELWQARWASDGVLEACWGGRLTGVSRSIGSFTAPFGTTATGLSLAGGLITPEELAAGRIDHALAISMVETKRDAQSWPANRNDGWVTGDDAIPEGLRFRLDPALDVDALPISRTAKIVAKALQTYGMVVRDTSGAVTFYAENVAAEGRPDPYPSLFGAPSYSVLNGIPWTRLQALPVDYGKP